MKKNILTIILSLAVTVSMMPAITFADSGGDSGAKSVVETYHWTVVDEEAGSVSGDEYPKLVISYDEYLPAANEIPFTLPDPPYTEYGIDHSFSSDTTDVPWNDLALANYLRSAVVLQGSGQNKVKPESTKDWFYFKNSSNLVSIDLSGLDTSEVTDMTSMFCDCSELETVDVSRLDTSNVESMKAMFSSCENLKTIDVSSFDTSNVTDMTDMFANCLKLETIDVSSFDTSNVTDMVGIFSGCRKLVLCQDIGQ